LESLWFHINKGASNYKNLYDENAIKNIVGYSTNITDNFQGEVNKCISEFNAKLNNNQAEHT